MLDGALDCWVFLSCLEVLHRIEGCCDQAQLAANCSHTVGLWAYATDKVATASHSLNLMNSSFCFNYLSEILYSRVTYLYFSKSASNRIITKLNIETLLV